MNGPDNAQVGAPLLLTLRPRHDREAIPWCHPSARMSQAGAAQFFKIDDQTPRSWTLDESKIRSSCCCGWRLDLGSSERQISLVHTFVSRSSPQSWMRPKQCNQRRGRDFERASAGTDRPKEAR